MKISRALIAELGLPTHEAERLVRSVLGLHRAQVVLGAELSGTQEGELRRLVALRRDGRPLQYLEGSVDFGPVTVKVDERALIPRPETELMWEMAERRVHAPKVIVDLCTGSGCLALALAASFPDARIYGSDLSRTALELARENAQHLNLTVGWMRGDLFRALPPTLEGEVDLLVCNPPYVSEAEYDELAIEIREYEPRPALVAGPDGTEMIARIGAEVDTWLAPGGFVFCEIGDTQAEIALAAFSSLADATIVADLTDRPRFVVGRKS